MKVFLWRIASVRSVDVLRHFNGHFALFIGAQCRSHGYTVEGPLVALFIERKEGRSALPA